MRLAIPSVRSRFATTWPARILTGILLVGLAAGALPAPVQGVSPIRAAAVTSTQPKTGVRTNATAPLEGIDVSRWQVTINWAQVKAAGKQFVVMKATEGTGYVDPMYSTNRAGAMAVGMPMAAYHFASPDSSANEATLEADHFVAVAGMTAGNLLPVLDLEQTGGLAPAALQTWVRRWLDEVTAKTGIKPMVYVSPSFWSTKVGNNTTVAAAGYKLWIANWGVTSPTVPANNWNGNGYTFWQYSDCGHVAGITTGCVDLDRYPGTDLTPVTYNPTFSLTAAPTGQSIMRGDSTTFAISVSRNQFVPPVTLSLGTALPGGTTASFSPNPVTGSTSTLTITTSNVPTVTPPGLVTPTIKGVGGGLTKTTVANLTVLPALPGPPTAPLATALDAAAFVTWTPPANDGGGAISSYTVTAAPDGKTCSATSGVSCIVTGLANGTAYTFTVAAKNSSGSGLASAPAAPVTPIQSIPGATYFGLTPTRLVDTRSRLGLIHGPLKAGALNTFQVTGVGTDPIPAGAIAVTGNLTVTGQTAPGFFSLSSVASASPKSSTINFPKGDTRANGVTVQLGPGGKLGLVYIAKAGAAAHAIFDVTGYFLPGASGASYFGLTPIRLVDTRSKLGLSAAVKAGVANTFQVTEVGDDPALKIPAAAVAVTGNLTVVSQTAAGYFALSSVATKTPKSSTLNFPIHDIRANAVTVALGDGGKLGLTYIAKAGATAHVIFDVTGYFLPGPSGASYFGLTPTRLVDTRSKTGLTTGAVKAGGLNTFVVVGVGDNPAYQVAPGAIAVTGNLTVVDASVGGYFSLDSVATTTPTTSTLNFPSRDIRANGVTIQLGPGGKLGLTYVARAGATAHVLFDVTGYFLPGS